MTGEETGAGAGVVCDRRCEHTAKRIHQLLEWVHVCLIHDGMVWSSVTCSQTQDTDRLESNRRVYCIDVNEQRKQGSNGRYRVFNLNGDDTDEDILCYQV